MRNFSGCFVLDRIIFDSCNFDCLERWAVIEAGQKGLATVTAVGLDGCSTADPVGFCWFDWNCLCLNGKESSLNCFTDIRPTEVKNTEQEMINKRKTLDKILMYWLDWKIDWNYTNFAVFVEIADADDQKA
jgi:hypothetical protein